MFKKIIPICLTLTLVLPSVVFASVGVGVNLGKIEIDEPLKPGGIYSFPSIGVINKGDEAGEFEFEITYHQDQPELRPEADWFRFTPTEFHLEPNKSQSVIVELVLPIKAKPGDYFAYLEAHPVVKAGPGTTIGVAAATKTYFTVEPANIWQSLIFRVSTFFAFYAPWTYVVLTLIIGAILITLFQKFFSFNLNIKKREHTAKPENKEEEKQTDEETKSEN